MVVEKKKEKRNDKMEYDACTQAYIPMYIHICIKYIFM